MQVKPLIEYSDFEKLDVRVGTVRDAVKVATSEKLLALTVDFGTFNRTILTGMQRWYSPEDFLGKQFIFLVNLAPKTMAGLTSEGMMLSAGIEHSMRPVLLSPNENVEMGEGIS